MEIEQAPRRPKTDELPLVRNYSSYREFVRDWFNYKKSLRSGFSYRQFSSRLGLKSPNFMQLVLAGERNLSDELAEKLSELMNLKGAQKNYFLALVHYEQARNPEEKAKLEKLLLAEKRKMVTTQIEKLRAEVLSSWHHMLVRELVFLPNFEPSGEFISRALSGLITPEEGEASIQTLLALELIKMDESGRYQASNLAVDTGDFVFERSLIQESHSQTLKTWGRNLARLNTDEQELGILHIPINSEKIPELRTRIRRFQDELIGWLCEEKNPDRVVQVGTYLIPFAKVAAPNNSADENE